MDYKQISQIQHASHCIIWEVANWKSKIDTEFEKAEEARARGNEGQARVCARRAAGIAVREFYARRGEIIRTPSAYDLLNKLIDDESVPDGLRQASSYLILRVNEEFKLPVNVDLVAEARKLCDDLFK